jgi:hypothetical protein
LLFWTLKSVQDIADEESQQFMSIKYTKLHSHGLVVDGGVPLGREVEEEMQQMHWNFT